MAITLRLHELLKAKNWTAYELAKRAKVSLTVAYRMAKPRARCRRYDEETLEKLMAALECDIGDLLHWDGRVSARRLRNR